MSGNVTLLGGVLVLEFGLPLSNLQSAFELRSKRGCSLTEALLDGGYATSELIGKALARIDGMEVADRKPVVLMVDDEPLILEIITDTLESFDAEIVTAENLAEARQAWATREDFDLVLLDKNLPDGSGIDLLKEFRESGRDCEIAMITGYANVSSAVEAIRYNISEYLQKPFDIADLHARIQRMLATQAIRRHNRVLVNQLRETSTRFVGAVNEAVQMLRNGDSAACLDHLTSVLSELDRKTDMVES